MKRYLNAAQPYLGGKRKIARQILQTIASDYEVEPGATFADAFAGGCAVGMAAKLLGYRVIANDRGPIAIATGKALIENRSRTLTREAITMALEGPPIEEMPSEKELSVPEACRTTLARMAGAAREAEGMDRSLLEAWTARTALGMSSWGIPTMGAGRRDFDDMTPGQATQLTRTGKPVSMALKAAKTLNAGVFDNGLGNEMRQGDAVEFLAEVEADVAYCNPPEAPIWMADMTHKPIGEIAVGDKVIGWAIGRRENPRTDGRVGTGEQRKVAERQRAWLRVATVERVQRRKAPLVKVTMESGRTIRCTPDHLWSRHPNSGRPLGRRQTPHEWITAEPGEYLSHVMDPIPELPPDLMREAAWLGGMFDGEGSAGRRAQPTIAQCRKHNPEVCDRLEATLTRLGFDWTYYEAKSGGGAYAIKGGRREQARFIVWCQPARWEKIQERILGANWRTKDKIIAVEPDGEGEVISMTTTTGNYVAWGYASKNCDPPYPGTLAYEQVYSGINHLLDPSLPTEPSPWSAADGWKLLREAFAAAEGIPLVVISMGKGADPDEIAEMMTEAGREPSWRSLDHKHLAALKRDHDPDGDELLLIGKKR